MNAPIRLWSPGAEDGRARFPRPKAHPVPLLRGTIPYETTTGPEEDHVILWRNEDAERCRLCPGECTFQPGPEGQGFCVVRPDMASIHPGLRARHLGPGPENGGAP